VFGALHLGLRALLDRDVTGAVEDGGAHTDPSGAAVVKARAGPLGPTRSRPGYGQKVLSPDRRRREYATRTHTSREGVAMSYARGTIAALVDAVVPETPTADDETQVPGGLAIDLDETVETAFNELQESPEGPIRSLGYETMPYAPLLAILLDLGALELILKREREEPLQSPAESFAGGPFSRLGPQDRMRAVRLLEADGVFPALDDRTGDAPVGIVAYLMQGAMFITAMAAYSDWGDDREHPQGWQQTDYPGPADGYAVHMGYEVEEFEENDYRDTGANDEGATVAADGAGSDTPDGSGSDAPDEAETDAPDESADAEAAGDDDGEWFEDQLDADEGAADWGDDR
jgi:hypothetical protein